MGTPTDERRVLVMKACAGAARSLLLLLLLLTRIERAGAVDTHRQDVRVGHACRITSPLCPQILHAQVARKFLDILSGSVLSAAGFGTGGGLARGPPPPEGSEPPGEPPFAPSQRPSSAGHASVLLALLRALCVLPLVCLPTCCCQGRRHPTARIYLVTGVGAA